MSKPKIDLRPPPDVVDPAKAQQFIEQGTIQEQPQLSVDSQHKRAAKGAATIVKRADGRERRRIMLYLEPATADALMTWCKQNGREASHVVDGLIATFLKKQRAK